MSAEELYIAKAEIARLRSDLAVEKINNKRLQSERNNAEVVCDSYAKENQQFSDTIDRLQAALEEIVNPTHEPPYRYSDAHEIARKALAKEGK